MIIVLPPRRPLRSKRGACWRTFYLVEATVIIGTGKFVRGFGADMYRQCLW
jgi:hypothetical protein